MPTAESPAVLVVGATRILRPAALSLARAGHLVHALARTGSDLAELAAEQDRIVPVVADWTDPDGFAEALVARPSRHAVAYCPDAPPATVAALHAAVPGRSVQLLTSAAARPGAQGPALPAQWRRLVLGWTGAPPRWHTPDEISAAALATLADGTDRVLGVVRPWADRPRG